MTFHIGSILLVLALTLVCVSGNHAVESEKDELPGVFGYPGRQRRTHSHLPVFSKKDKGKGKGGFSTEMNGEWVWITKSDKKSKSSKSEKKDKKGKSGKYYWVTRGPTANPAARVPTVSPSPASKSSGKGSKSIKSSSRSEDIHSSASEDCPPARPPSVIPPTPSAISKKPTSMPVASLQNVAMETYAIDYTLSQTDRAPIKADFLALQKITEDFLKDHMVNAYKVSTQANLVDFETSFVTAYFTPGEPIHIQYNSTASFDKESTVNIPTPETLFTVLKESLKSPKTYVDLLKSQLSNENPFSSTTNTVITDPRATPETRSAKTRSTSMFGIAGAGVIMVLTLTIFVGVNRCRNDDKTDDNVSLSKKIRSDSTVAGETFVSEINDSTHDGRSVSMFSSTGFVENNWMRKYESSAEKNNSRTNYHDHDVREMSDVIMAPQRRPRTVAEIENLLSLGDGDVI